VANLTAGICRLIVGHFQRHRERKPWAFVCRVAPESTGLCFAAGLVMYAIGVPERGIDLGAAGFAFFALAIAPPLETLLLQALPVFVARKCRARLRYQIVASWLPFALFHVPEGLGTVLAAGTVGGFYFAFTYAHWRQKSRWTAFWTTWAVHTIQNGIVVTLLLVSGEM